MDLLTGTRAAVEVDVGGAEFVDLFEMVGGVAWFPLGERRKGALGGVFGLRGVRPLGAQEAFEGRVI